jgi:predicted dithiol-disulfide oxidoreductase (DUF899 family)
MFAPEWDAGCKSCSFWADNFDGIVVHLEQRDVALAAVSRAPLEKLRAFADRMRWRFRWVSSGDSEFPYDYGVSFRASASEGGGTHHNYATYAGSMADLPGLSVFYRSAPGTIFHTYSTYARGLDMLNGAYQLLDLVPKGRDEADLPHSMAWVRLKDRYGV